MISTTLKLEKYIDYFEGREEYVAVQGSNHYYPIVQELNDSVVTKHLEGIKTFGVYVLTKTSKCNFICIDIDIEKSELSKVNFADSKIKFEYLKRHLLKFQKILEEDLFNSKNILYEDSGGRGYHIWVFFEKPIEGYDAIFLNEIIKHKLDDFTFEFFPKQPDLNKKRKYGNLIKLPLGEHKKYNNRSRFFTLTNKNIEFIDRIDNNLNHLNNVAKVKNSDFLKLIGNFKETLNYNNSLPLVEEVDIKPRRIFKSDIEKLFFQCNAMNALKVKAFKSEALSHTELTYLSSTLLSLKDSKDYIHSLVKSSLGTKYSYEIAEKELNLLEQLHPASCKTLIEKGICKGYCKPEFQKKNEDRSLRNTSPLHSQKILYQKSRITLTSELLDKICSLDNIRLAYYRLREYHKHEDALFYDEFDFSFFEDDFDTNIKLISLILKNKVEIPSLNYEKVHIPKKIDDEGKMVKRQMAYSSVFDQLIVQSVFNVIGEILEGDFLDCSYGYRQNITDRNAYNIFEDWREQYPIFRNTVLNKLRDSNIKYYICCDIKGYYDNIRKDILLSQIRSLIDNDFIISILEKVINSYSFNDNTNLGIPQGPAYARPLANLYLNDFDKELNKLSVGYFRYVDDFYVLFDSYEKATKIKEWIVNRLGKLGLELSNDKNKKAVITESIDESILQEKINSVRYGIFEDHKFLPNLNEENISEFYDTIIENAYDANDKNKEIPTLVFFGTTPKISPERKHVIVNIVEEHAKKKEFFPKKIKNIFPRLLEIYQDINKDYFSFYQLLEDPINKVYFLIEVYEKYKTDKEYYKESLVKILQDSISSDNPFLLGFGLRICFVNPELLRKDINEELIQKVRGISSIFLYCKVFISIDYFNLNTEIQNEVEKCFPLSSAYIIKKALLSGIEEVKNIKEIDNILFSRLLINECLLVHGECCKILTLINSNIEFLRIFTGFLESEKPKYNDFLVTHLGKVLYEKYQDADRRILENLKTLFKDQPGELFDIINIVLDRIDNKFKINSSFHNDGFNSIDTYNNCNFYQSVENEEDFREVLPFTDSLRHQELIQHIDELIMEFVIPVTNHEYRSTQKEVILNLTIPSNFVNISDLSFDLNDNLECYNFLFLINNLLKKSIIYYKITTKIPSINNNIKVDPKTFEVVFLKRGKDNTNLYNCDTEKIDSNNPQNVIKLVNSFIFNSLFKTKNEFDKYINFLPKTGIQLFAFYLIKRLNNNNIQIDKVSYLFDLIPKDKIDDEVFISYLFFSEKLKINVFKNCDQFINWKGIANGLIELYGDFAYTYKKINFSNINLKNNIFLNNRYPSGLNKISKNLINLNSNLNNFLPELTDNKYLKYFQVLNIFSVYSLEIHSLFKSILIIKKDIEPISVNISFIQCENLLLKLNVNELRNINHLVKLNKSNTNDIFNNSINYSLKEISILCLLTYLDFSINEDKILISKTKKRSDELFLDLILNRNPKIEESVYKNVSLFNDSLRNYYREPDVITDTFRKDCSVLLSLIFQIRKIQKSLRVKRRKCTYRKNIFNEFELFKMIGVTKKVPISLTYHNPFTDTYNNIQRTGKLQYEIRKGKIFNVLLPDKRFDTLYSNLKKGRLFKSKVTFLYSGKSLLIFDLVFFALFICLIYRVNILIDSVDTNENLSALLWIARAFSWLIVTILGGKILSIDLSHWSKSISNFIKKIKGN